MLYSGIGVIWCDLDKVEAADSQGVSSMSSMLTMLTMFKKCTTESRNCEQY